MAGRSKSAGNRVGVAAIGGALALAVAAAGFAGMLEPLERRALDWRFEKLPQRLAPMDPAIRFVDIDDGALRVGGRWPWPREQLALALQELALARPRAVAIDLLLAEPEAPRDDGGPGEGDARLAQAVAAAPTLLAIDVGAGDGRRLAPIPPLAASSCGAGGVHFEPDADGALRSIEVLQHDGGARVLTLGVAAALLHQGRRADDVVLAPDSVRVGDTELRLRDGRLWFDWPTPSGAPADDASRWLHCAPRCSLGRLLDVARADLDVAAQLRGLDELASEIGRDFGISGHGESLLVAIREETRFRLEDASAAAGAADLTEEEERQLAPFRRFAQLDGVVAAGRGTVEAARAELEATLSDRLVFVGWTATGAASDFVPTPLSSRTPGVFAHAVAADMVLSGRSLRFLSREVTLALPLLIGALATAACLLPPLGSFAAMLALLGGFLGGALLAFVEREMVVPLVAPLGAGAVAWIGGTALQAALAQRDQRRITRQFKTRVAPELVDYLVEHPDALSMAGEPREVTAFFVDLAGFTSIAEQLGAQQTVALLNRCMTAATDALTAHGAYVNKYLGDGLMAFWSAFRPDPDQATRACRAALATQAALAEVVDRARVAARIGIATGRVIVGDCGAPPRLHDYTAIGDAINLAARLESANKQFGTKILVDGRTRTQVSDDGLRFRDCGRVAVVGQTTPVDLFELVGDDAEHAGDDGSSSNGVVAAIELTEAAVDAFREGDLARSSELFLRLEGETGPSKLAGVYLDAIAHAPSDFDGVLRLQSK